MVDSAGNAAPSPEAEDPEPRELRQYMEELWKRIPDHARRAASIKPGASGSVEWYAAIGRFWWEERNRAGLSRYQVAETMNVDVNRVRFLEVGVADPHDLRNGFLRMYAGALERPDLIDEFSQRFRISIDGKQRSS